MAWPFHFKTDYNIHLNRYIKLFLSLYQLNKLSSQLLKSTDSVYYNIFLIQCSLKTNYKFRNFIINLNDMTILNFS